MQESKQSSGHCPPALPPPWGSTSSCPHLVSALALLCHLASGFLTLGLSLSTCTTTRLTLRTLKCFPEGSEGGGSWHPQVPQDAKNRSRTAFSHCKAELKANLSKEKMNSRRAACKAGV